jgi:hypothetical protein
MTLGRAIKYKGKLLCVLQRLFQSPQLINTTEVDGPIRIQSLRASKSGPTREIFASPIKNEPTATSVDPTYFVAAHEAGHAFACILAHHALGRDHRSFERVFIRREFSSPYIDRQNRKVNCIGMCEGPPLYAAGVDILVFHGEPKPQPGVKLAMLARMEWEILTLLAGPFAEAASREVQKRDMSFAAQLVCGSTDDYGAAKAVLRDYRKASKRRCGMPVFEDRTCDLVLKSWPAINELAKHLLVKETLNHDDAYAVVEPFLEAS